MVPISLMETDPGFSEEFHVKSSPVGRAINTRRRKEEGESLWRSVRSASWSYLSGRTTFLSDVVVTWKRAGGRIKRMAVMRPGISLRPVYVISQGLFGS
ncbi:hypothetical protein AVEN_8527-1 [Araneus ventricosus]|uniref:Uncharacterized protein n=1 Tax=Araneus ventricosus TaxID=182803 RepID=A0A4Y2FMZ4_ARAVE|nr:hypothetical protein AVEN_8527-1 [Araneus ventricosus]